jgi:LysM repeat protein
MFNSLIIPRHAILFAIFMAFTLVLPHTTEAQSNRQTHIVRQGETLFSISRQYNVSVNDLREWNNLRGSQINVGQRIIVGPPGNTPNPQAPPPSPQQTQSQSQPNDGSAIRHQVRAGETLFSLSRRYAVTVNDIRSWNNLQSNLLEVGQILTIYSDGRDVPETTPTLPERPQPQSERPAETADTLVAPEQVQNAIVIQEAGSAYHVVKSGDTMIQIANANGISVEDLMALNRLQSNRLTVGQVLMVRRPSGLPSVATGTSESSAQGRFATHEIRRNERINDILTRYQMTEKELVALNPDINISNLQPGLSLSVLLPPTNVFRNPYRIDSSNGSNTNTESSVGVVERASRYNDTDRGRSASNGDLYNPLSYTAAHQRLPLGTVVYVQNEATGYGIFVLINDRTTESGIKLSHAAFEKLGFSLSADNRAIIKQ